MTPGKAWEQKPVASCPSYPDVMGMTLSETACASQTRTENVQMKQLYMKIPAAIEL